MTTPWTTTLDIDALYFRSAREALLRAKEASLAVDRAKSSWQELEAKEQKTIYANGGDPGAWNDELESLSIQMVDLHESLARAYAPLLKETALVHILVTNALEAHINGVAIGDPRTKFSDFERLSLEDKWSQLPIRLRLPGFEKGKYPFQGLSKTVAFRNELVHYKQGAIHWDVGVTPLELKRLGLTIEDATESVTSAQELIKELWGKLERNAPPWIDMKTEELRYFGTIANF